MRVKQWGPARSMPRTVFIFAAFIELLLLFAPNAWAVPSYTRRYGVECSTCHTMWGALNLAGNTFKLSGYRAIAGVDLKPDSEDIEIAHGTLTIPTTLPLSFITGVGVDGRSEKRSYSNSGINAGIANATTKMNGASINLEDASIFMTSPLGKHLSVFVEFPMRETKAWEFTPGGLSSVYAQNFVGGSRNIQFKAESPTFEVAKFFWNNLLGDMAPRDSVNLMFGLTHLPLAYSPGKVRLSVNQYLIYERRGLDLISRTPMESLVGGADPADGLFRLGEPQGQIELEGMIVPGGQVTDVRNSMWVEYHVGVSNGSNVNADNNAKKDFFGRVTLRGKGQSLGFFGYSSPDTYDDTLRTAGANQTLDGGGVRTVGIMSGAQVANKHTTYGPNFTLSMVPFGVPVWLDNDILFRRDSNPTGFGVPFKWHGGFHQVNWQPSKETIAYARIDWIRGSTFDDTGAIVNGISGSTLVKPQENDYVLGAQHLISPNLKMTAEFRHKKFEDKAGAGSLTDNGFTARFMMGF